jgi:NitT/TauT family transport system substrate-binding protein
LRGDRGMMRWLVLAAGLWLCRPALAETVNVGLANTLADCTLYVAADRGYFAAEGLEINFVVLDSGGKMIAPLGSGQLDVGSGALSAGFYNAVDRKVDMRVVADRGHTAPGFDYQTLAVRKSLVDSGAFKGLADLKGKKMGFAAPGVTSMSVLNEAMKVNGMTIADTEPVFLSFPQQLVALKNGAIDGSMFIEPYATIGVQAGDIVRVMPTENWYPADLIGVIFYGEKLVTERPETGRKFMRAYLRAVRDYMAAIHDGHIGSDSIAQSIVDHFHVPMTVVRAMYAQYVDVNGVIPMASMRRDWQFFKDQGLIKGVTPIEQIVDMSFVERAAKSLTQQ